MDLVGSHGSVLDLVVLIPVCSKPQLAKAVGFFVESWEVGVCLCSSIRDSACHLLVEFDMTK